MFAIDLYDDDDYSPKYNDNWSAGVLSGIIIDECEDVNWLKKKVQQKKEETWKKRRKKDEKRRKKMYSKKGFLGSYFKKTHICLRYTSCSFFF